jgi:hypothetical protein
MLMNAENANTTYPLSDLRRIDPLYSFCIESLLGSKYDGDSFCIISMIGTHEI